MKKVTWTKEQALQHIDSKIQQVEVVDDLGPCWEWQGSKTRDGYGQFGAEAPIRLTGQKLTHRAMYALQHNFLFTSRNQQVMHKCHNRGCCNPDHLKIGTAKENMADARARGSFDGISGPIARGEANVSSKLTDEAVRTIRALSAQKVDQDTMAARFGVSQTTISRVVRRASWKHVE